MVLLQWKQTTAEAPDFYQRLAPFITIFIKIPSIQDTFLTIVIVKCSLACWNCLELATKRGVMVSVYEMASWSFSDRGFRLWINLCKFHKFEVQSIQSFPLSLELRSILFCKKLCNNFHRIPMQHLHPSFNSFHAFLTRIHANTMHPCEILPLYPNGKICNNVHCYSMKKYQSDFFYHCFEPKRISIDFLRFAHPIDALYLSGQGCFVSTRADKWVSINWRKRH